jgi:hypothetical protein
LSQHQAILGIRPVQLASPTGGIEDVHIQASFPAEQSLELTGPEFFAQRVPQTLATGSNPIFFH